MQFYHKIRIILSLCFFLMVFSVVGEAAVQQVDNRLPNYYANSVPVYQWPDFSNNGQSYLMFNALWVGWDDEERAWKYNKVIDASRGTIDPGDPVSWIVTGNNVGFFHGKLDQLPPGTHINNKYNPDMPAYRCGQDDIQVKVGTVWIDKYSCRIIDVGADYKGADVKGTYFIQRNENKKDSQHDHNHNDFGILAGNGQNVPPYWMAFSQRAECSTGMTWFVARRAAVNAGKRLVTNGEWQDGAAGTALSKGRGGELPASWDTIAAQEISTFGCVGMAGNVNEWVSDWMQGNGMFYQGPVQKNAFDEIEKKTSFKSEEIWEELKKNYYLDENRKISSRFQPDMKAFTLEIDPKFKDIEKLIVETLKMIRIGKGQYDPGFFPNTGVSYGNDSVSEVKSASNQAEGQCFPAALLRGGELKMNEQAGVFSIMAGIAPSSPCGCTGFRCAK
ncbi:MAG TPA: hypothetical protein DCS13_07875 [Candidatus Margulisbacteria bacterium]|nr:MAG: hypothetical protein A2X43_07165 [Candidatus Margulisbacteria bacterium GWD2_39_127]HAR63364.1 hypothetical protein [Candidatus Margulisiibacteriota bacterium]